MDINLTGALATNVSLMQGEASTDYSTVISAGAVLLGVIISQFFEWLKRHDDDQKEARKRFFSLKKEAYFRLIEDATSWINYALVNPEPPGADSPPLSKLRISCRMAQLVGNKNVESVIKNGWADIGDSRFIEDVLIPALRNDLKDIEAPQNRPWWKFWG
jgi:hypothetical protein